MVEITEATANEQTRDQFNRGFTALERNNLDYAIDMLLTCVEMEPAFLHARKFLRAASIRRFMSRGGNAQVHHAVALVGGISDVVKYLLAMHGKRPLEALQATERLMAKDPLHPWFIRGLCRAAEAAEMPEIAIQTLTLVREHMPDSAPSLFMLGKLYVKTGQTQLALQCFEEQVNTDPNDAEALKALKDAMAVNSMNRDGWENAARDGFRSAIKDAKESEILERESKAVMGEQDIEALILENEEKIRKEPANLNYRRSLAGLYANAERFDEAIAALEAAQTLGMARDPQIDQTIMQYRIQQYDAAIAASEAAGDTAAVETARRERDDFHFDSLQQMVKRYPNDLALRFDLGIRFFERQQDTEAIQQFQAALRSPKHRLRAVYYLALCFKNKKQYDMAIGQLEQAANESGPIDETRKDIIYQLGLILTETGKTEQAREWFKKIYQVDIGYKDVAQRIEATPS